MTPPADVPPIDMNEVVGSHDLLLVTLDTLRHDVAQELAAAGRIPNLARHLPGGAWERRHAPGNFTYASHQAMFAGFLPTPATPGPHPRLFAARFAGSETTADGTFVYLMQVGPTGSSASHTADPIVLHDVFFRIGGDVAGKATQSLVINSNDVIGDDLWLWRADHTNGVGWTTNPALNGLVVNGNNVTMYGLAVEHYQKYQTTWNGSGGRTYFYQSETPYDVPNQSSWTTSGGDLGYASYKVANSVTSHEAWGVGVYAYLRDNPSVVLGHAIEVPTTSTVKFHSMVTTVLGGAGTINHIVDNTGNQVTASSNVAYLVSYP